MLLLIVFFCCLQTNEQRMKKIPEKAELTDALIPIHSSIHAVVLHTIVADKAEQRPIIQLMCKFSRPSYVTLMESESRDAAQ